MIPTDLEDTSRPGPRRGLAQTVYYVMTELNILARPGGISKEEMQVRCMDLMLALQDALDAEFERENS